MLSTKHDCRCGEYCLWKCRCFTWNMAGRREGFFPLAEWFHVKHQSSQQLVGEGSHTPKPSPTHHVSRETSTNSWSNEAHSVVGKCGSASQGINTHNHFLGVRKSRLDDTFFLTPTIGFPNAEWTSKTRCFTWNLEAYSAARKIHPHQQVENQREHTI